MLLSFLLLCWLAYGQAQVSVNDKSFLDMQVSLAPTHVSPYVCPLVGPSIILLKKLPPPPPPPTKKKFDIQKSHIDIDNFPKIRKLEKCRYIGSQ